MSVFEKIEAQQKGKENTPEWMVGEQLKEICAAEPDCAELVEKDLDAIPLSKAAAKIKAHADELHKKLKGSCVCVPPDAAENIIRECYGLPAKQKQVPAAQAAELPKQDDGLLDLDAFL